MGIASASTAKPVLVVNGFDRTGAPDDFRSNDDEQAGFLADDDNGVPYKQMIGYVGKMKEFRRAIPGPTTTLRAMATATATTRSW